MTDAEKIEKLEGILAQEDLELAYTQGQMGGWVPLDDDTFTLFIDGLTLLRDTLIAKAT